MRLNETEQTQADRIFYYIALICILFSAGFYIASRFFDLTILHIPCPIYSKTGIYCPACGGTRAFYYLMSGQILNSFKSNPFVLYLTVTGGLFFLSQLLYRLTRGRIHGLHFRLIYVYTGIALMLINCIYKNRFLFLFLFSKFSP